MKVFGYAGVLWYAGYDRHELNMIFQLEHLELGHGPCGKWNDAAIPLPELKAVFNKWQTGLAGKAWNALCWSNHDQPRAVSRFGDDGFYRVESAKMLATCLHLMPGTPFIYQGEELGMTNAGFEHLDDYRDIESINAYHDLVEVRGLDKATAMTYLKKISRDNARTPMQWTAGAQAGFTAGTPWIAANPNHTVINAESQLEDENSVFSYYRRLIRLRRERPAAIVYGDFALLLPDSDEIFAYTRQCPGTQLTVVCNFTGREIPCPIRVRGGQLLIGSYASRRDGFLQPYEAVVYEKQG